ncbi:hypothetical protein [Yinghuangia seranimata]|uniref:hypothetical protein n=1 Tax=Yinghuangia seranimata TaxID=408067 RepID=UPI00248CC09B|nr:hypothetical protein [Yinghuangia seranimata]MDI2130589.1 hypothetical protein [Yinghuangia seranimata]
MPTVRLHYAADAFGALSDLYRDPTRTPRVLAADSLAPTVDPATGGGLSRIAAHLDRPGLYDGPARRFTGRDMIDAALGRAPRAADAGQAPGPIAVLHLAPDQDPGAGPLTDTACASLARTVLCALGQDRWPRDHPWLVLRAADGIRLLTHTTLPNGEMDDARRVTEPPADSSGAPLRLPLTLHPPHRRPALGPEAGIRTERTRRHDRQHDRPAHHRRARAARHPHGPRPRRRRPVRTGAPAQGR